MWLSPRLVARSHSKFFNAVFQSAVVRGSSSSAATRTAAAAAATPLSADQRARLDAAVAAATAEATAAAAAKAARARDTLGSLSSTSSLSAGELLSWARWALLEPEGGGGGAPRLPWHLRWLRRTLVAPLYLAFPLAPRLLSIRDTRDVAVDALRPYLKAKGLRVSKKGRGSRQGFSSAAAADASVDDACFFSKRSAWECRSFGAVAAALGCVPVLSWLLAFATTAGAALWAADLERFGGGSRALVPPPAVPAPAEAAHKQVELASKQAASAASASKQEL